MAKFPVTIEIDNADGTLRPGQGVDYRISSSIAEDCIIVDTAAIVYTDEGPAVYAKPAEGQTFETTIPILEGTIVPEGFFLIPVEIGIADDTSTEIVSGLDEGIEVYLASTSMVMDDTMMDGAVMVG